MENEYAWQAVYQRAVLEADNGLLQRWIDEARGMINGRLRELGATEQNERAAITKALDALWLLEQERLGRRSS